MVANKISEKLAKILAKEITNIELPISNFTSDNSLDFSDDKEKQNKTQQNIKKTPDSHITLPVSINGYIPVIITFTDFTAMNSLNIKLILSGARIKYEYNIIPAIAASITESQIQQLVQLAEVSIVGFDDYAVATLDTARKWFGVDEAVKTFSVTGNEGFQNTFTKQDNVIAIIDTGIDINHIDLGSGKVIAWHDEINPGSTIPYDDNGHGTHVSSIAAGLGKSIWDYRGVAYGAALVGVKVLSANGFGSYSQIIAGIQWCVTNKITYGIKVINMSLGGPSDVNLRAAVAAAYNHGIVVVCAAGNSGPSLNTIGSPGDAKEAITVGNMADVGQGGYLLIPSSSRGPVFDGSIKPDLVAPGYNITAAKAGTTNEYITFTGTSMASPFVAGVVALMLNSNSSLTLAQIKQILTSTAELWGSHNPNNDYGHGRLQSFKVLSLVSKLHDINFCTGCSHNNNCCPSSSCSSCSKKFHKGFFPLNNHYDFQISSIVVILYYTNLLGGIII